jgi:hypothetical protein
MTEFEKFSLIINAIKAAAGAALPIVVVIIGFHIDRRQKAIEAKTENQRDIISRRFLKYDEISLLCNDIYCFTALIGQYKSISPYEIIEKKHKLEYLVFASLPVWGDKFCEAVNDFIKACFVDKRGAQMTAVSLSDGNRQKAERTNLWDDEMSRIFLTENERTQYLKTHFDISPKDSYRKSLLRPRYAKLLCALSESIGGTLTSEAALRLLEAEQ